MSGVRTCVSPERLNEIIQAGMVARRIVEEMPLADTTDLETLERIMGFPVEDEGQRVSMLSTIVSKVMPQETPHEVSLTHWRKVWLDTLPTMAPLTFRDYRLWANGYCGPEDVSTINEMTVVDHYRTLKEASYGCSRKRKNWIFFQQFVTFLFEQRVIEMPRNLRSFYFEMPKKKVKEYDLTMVKEVLAGLSDRNRLYALLGLNTGMTSADIGQLTHGMIVDGFLTRKREKTKNEENVPTVTYPLWPETLALLERCKSNHPTLVLTSSTGTPLWEATKEADGSTPHKDLMGKQWSRAEIEIPHKAFRSIGATVLDRLYPTANLAYAFLAHSLKSIKEKHYVPPNQAFFNSAILEMRTAFFST
jgi:integrase